MYTNLSDIPEIFDLTPCHNNDSFATPIYSNTPINLKHHSDSDSPFMIDTTAFNQLPFTSEGTYTTTPQEHMSPNAPTSQFNIHNIYSLYSL